MAEPFPQASLPERTVWGEQALDPGRAPLYAPGHLSFRARPPGGTRRGAYVVAAPDASKGAFDLGAVVEAALAEAQPRLGHSIVLRTVRPLLAFGLARATHAVIYHLLVLCARRTAGRSRPGVIHVDTLAAGARIQARVCDNGCPDRAHAMELLEAGADGPYEEARGRLRFGDALAVVSAAGAILSCTPRHPHGLRFALDLPAARRSTP